MNLLQKVTTRIETSQTLMSLEIMRFCYKLEM